LHQCQHSALLYGFIADSTQRQQSVETHRLFCSHKTKPPLYIVRSGDLLAGVTVFTNGATFVPQDSI